MEPITLTVSAYKQLRIITNTINNITDVISMGGDVRKDLVVNLLVQLGEQVQLTLGQLERDTKYVTTKNRSSHGSHVDP